MANLATHPDIAWLNQTMTELATLLTPPIKRAALQKRIERAAIDEFDATVQRIMAGWLGSDPLEQPPEAAAEFQASLQRLVTRFQQAISASQTV